LKSLCFILSLTLIQYSCAGTFRDKIREHRGARNNEGTNDKVFNLEHGGLTRTYKVHSPPSYKKETPLPLLIALHGGGGDMNYQSTEKYYHQISKSDSTGFIVAFPNGFSRFGGKLATWNAGNCCGKGRDNNVDDVGFIKAMIEKISSDYSIDKKKIFITGMSNGGMMTYRIACELSDVITGIASVAGTDNTISCSPTHPVSVLHIHAKDDDHVLFNGGAGQGSFRNEKQVTNFTSVPATIAKWVKFNGCSDKPKRILEKSGAWCDLYSGCKSNVHVQLCVTETGGHSWPGGEKVRAGKGGTPSTAISANDVMWDFFAL
jgi:polyhydroxybutyrate depolymerase